ncbi:Nudix family hydrolase [Pollutimonas harenae]|uniref:8-oxo-dGTP diphosphatase n=1 Tax=Pollutimonas harenae TaxID=657015 RepID=A0A853GWP3_9BURK|nr:Nudix family hydrolase [Pollutimonas harenae]NYT84180.1 Nudix family hydrolase [Pollutimonas harenae]TEA73404.1 Nudix family hydrolase [Pollutimonas harenae]
MSKPFIEVAAGLIMQPDGSLLLAQRPDDKPWSGWWELPGGKIEPGETTLQALARELKEELNIDVTAATPWVTYTHEYPKNIVRLAFCRVTGWEGEPTGMEGQQLSWVKLDAPLSVGPLLPATEPPLRWIQLPDHYLLTSIGSSKGLDSYLARLTQALQNGLKLVQFREPGWEPESDHDIHTAFQQVLTLCHQYSARCLINSCHPETWWTQADGVHLRAADACELASAGVAIKDQAPGLLAVSAHNANDLDAARMLAADFAVLGHVLDTPSHPGEPGIGWAQFASLIDNAGLPVFAIGGQSVATLETARQHGAHGIAGIRQLLT